MPHDPTEMFQPFPEEGESAIGDAPAAQAPIQPLPVLPVRFCGKCGTPWDSAWESCPKCAARSRASAVVPLKRDMGSIKAAIGLYFSLLAVSFISLLVAINSDSPPSVTHEFAASIALSLMTLFWCMGLWQFVQPTLTQRFSPVWLIAGAGMAIGTFLIATTALAALQKLGLEILKYSDPFDRAGYGFGWVVLVICVQPAIFEELAFRGIVQSALLGVLGARHAIIVSAMMFAILHLSPAGLPHLVVIGLALGWLRVKTGSLLPGMALHFVHNFLAVLAEKHGGFLPW